MMDKHSNFRELFIGVDEKILDTKGEEIIPINFDNAATTPAFSIVKENIDKYIKIYGSIGRGKGLKSIETTENYEECRNIILDFFGIDKEEYTVIFVKNTTEGINLLANVLVDSKKDKILTTRMEHHANDLPWRANGEVLYLETNKDGVLILDNLENLLKSNNIKLVAITAASNVTGYVNEIERVTKIAHKYGVNVVLDAAQIIAHRKLEFRSDSDSSLDFVVFSGHKMYAPFGSGVIVAKKELLKNKRPYIRGGGAIDIVFDEEEYWGEIPYIYEAGTPNYFGALAIASAMMKINEIGFDEIKNHEKMLKDYLYENISNIPGIIIYGNDISVDRLGICSFNLKNKDHAVVAKELSYLREIAIRDGCFCAHSYVKRLLGLADQDTKKYLYNQALERPGLVRVSFGLYNDISEIQEFLNCLEYIATHDEIMS
ncbi:MAG: aminotransferase class V-fold PLP-dependent enzyme [Sarcina sp.]